MREVYICAIGRPVDWHTGASRPEIGFISFSVSIVKMAADASYGYHVVVSSEIEFLSSTISAAPRSSVYQVHGLYISSMCRLIYIHDLINMRPISRISATVSPIRYI